MKDFAAFEAKHERTPVRLIDYESATGVLHLKGDDTLLHVTSPKEFQPGPRDENGWFWLRLESPDGKVLLLHHAVMVQDMTHTWEHRDHTYSAQIYPNLVVDDVRGLTEDQKVARIVFRLRGLRNFFYYSHAEPLLGFKGTDDQIAALRSMRSSHHASDDDAGDLFAPDHVYVMHHYPTFLKFRAEDRTYEVWAGGTRSFGLHKINAEAYPIASIGFDEPVTLDDALYRVWEWRTFFAEMAMLPLQAESLTVRASLNMIDLPSDLYMPGATRYPDFEDSYYKLHPAHLPLNLWEDRQALSDCMQQWFSRAGQRATFRRKLYRVIESMNRRIDGRDLIDVASAVESLEELSSVEPLKKEALDSMTAAASAAANEANIDIDPGRIRGVLGNLQRPSLAARYARLAQHVTPKPSDGDVDLLIRSATRIRHASAHGGALEGEIQPRVSPTVQALTALCARFDLETCGVPAKSGSDRAMTKIRFDDGIRELKHIEAEAKPVTPAV